MKTLTAAEAHRQFSAVLRAVSQGERITVTSRGKPVATIEPDPRPGVRRARQRRQASAVHTALASAGHRHAKLVAR